MHVHTHIHIYTYVCMHTYIHGHMCTPKELSRHRLSVTTVLVVSVNIAVTAAALVVIYYYWSPSL